MKICVIGLGYVGTSLSFFLTEKNHEVIGVDNNEEKIQLLKENKISFIDEKAKDLLKKHNGKNLSFSSSLEEGINEAEVIFLCLPTPSCSDGSINLSYIEDICEQLLSLITSSVILVIRSTVPVGTGKKIQALFKETPVTVISNPDFLTEEYSIADLIATNKIIIGHNSPTHAAIISSIYEGKKILLMDHTSAELARYATQAALASRLSFINEISNISDYFGGDIIKIKETLTLDERIGTHYLNPGLGFGGASIPKDITSLLHETKKRNIETPLISAIKKVNDERIPIFVEKIKNELSIETFNGLHLSIFGIAYKNNIDQIKTSRGCILAELLLYKDVKLTIYDEFTKKHKGPNLTKAVFHKTPQEAVKNSNGLLILTSNKEYRNLDFSSLCSQMKNKIIFDPWGILANIPIPEEIKYIGI